VFIKSIALTMNVQAEKLKLIEWLVQLQDLDLIKRIQALKDAAEVAAYEASLEPMTVEELVARAKASNQAIQEGRVSDIDTIMEEDWD